jgi:hypothetical protein
MQTVLDVIARIADFVFFAPANATDLTLDKQLVKRILNFMPFPPDAENNEAVLKNSP